MTILKYRLHKIAAVFLVITAMILSSGVSVCRAENLVVSFNTSGNDYIQIKSAQNLELSSFKVNNPYRLVVDLKNVSINPQDFEKKHPQIKNIMVNQTGNSVRIAIEPRANVQLYVRQNSQNDVTIFGTAAVSDTATPASSSPASSPAYSQPASAATDHPMQPVATALVKANSLVIKDGLLTIGTDGFIDNVTTYSMPESNRFVFVLANTLLNFKQGRYKLDFHNLTGMDAEQQGNNARLTFHVKPNTSVPNYFSSKESDSLQIRFFVTEGERELQQETHTKKQLFDQEKSSAAKYKGPRISLDFDNADLRHIFRMLAEVTKKNYVLSDSVKGSMSLKLMNVPWQQAQELILRAHNLIVVEEGNVSEVITVAQKAERIKRQLEFDDFKKSQEQIGICSVQLRHAASAKVAAAASTILTRGAKEFSREAAAKVQAQRQGTENTTANADGTKTDANVDRNANANANEKSPVFSINNIYAEPNTNRLIIRDYPSKFPEILKVLSLLDVPDQQVMIEARIVEASTDFQRSLGVQWGIHYRDGSASFLGINSLDTGFGGITNDPPQSGTSGPGMATGISFGTLSSNINLDLKFSAAAGAGMIKIVSTPKVAVAYGEKATIKDGKKQPYQTTSQNGTQTQFVEAVLSLEVTPTITPSCDVVMDLKITNDSVGTSTGSTAPPINQKSAETKLTVRSGDTAVIGGTYVNSETETDDGVPYLMDIPLLGRLFKSKSSTKNNRELLVFITPKLLNNSCKDSGVMNLKYEKLECTAF